EIMVAPRLPSGSGHRQERVSPFGEPPSYLQITAFWVRAIPGSRLSRARGGCWGRRGVPSASRVSTFRISAAFFLHVACVWHRKAAVTEELVNMVAVF